MRRTQLLTVVALCVLATGNSCCVQRLPPLLL